MMREIPLLGTVCSPPICHSSPYLEPCSPFSSELMYLVSVGHMFHFLRAADAGSAGAALLAVICQFSLMLGR